MKSNNITKIIIFTILIVVCIYLSVFGIYIKKEVDIYNLDEETSISNVYDIDVYGIGYTDDAVIKGAKSINTGLDISGGVSITYQVLNEGQDVSLEELQKIESVMRKRLETVNIFDYYLRLDDNLNRVYIEIPTNTENEDGDPLEAVEGLDKTAKIEFRSEEGEVLLSGDDIKSASYSVSAVDGTGIPAPHVVLEFSEEGATKFTEATSNHVGETMPITLDGEIITSPMINTAIEDNSAIITMGSGSYNEKEIQAKEYAMLIDSGSLPFDLEVIDKEYIGAYIGQKALDISIKAGIIAFILITIIMIVIYRLPGVTAIISLMAYVAILLFILNNTGISLTLPGIAGLILSVGMAVDANVIIFERLREELTPTSSHKRAFNRSFKIARATILDGNTTTFIVAILLYIFGIGPVKGFGIILAIGVIISLFTSLVITKHLLKQVLPLSMNKPSLFGIKKEEK